MKNVEFCRKTSKFLPKRCLFLLFIFYLNEKEWNQQACPIKYVENEIYNATSHNDKKERERERERKRERERERERERDQKSTAADSNSITIFYINAIK